MVDKLSDADAKHILLTKWPAVTQMWPSDDGEGAWLRAQPVSGTSGPRLSVPGARAFRTQPDGLWLYFNGDNREASVDAIVIEVCGSFQNLNDKRSRYMPATHSTVAWVPNAWIAECLGRTGGRISGQAISDSLPTPSSIANEVCVPLRSLTVLYALPNDRYDTWFQHHIPSGHEYFMPHSALGSFSSPAIQEFLKRLTSWSHFLRTP